MVGIVIKILHGRSSSAKQNVAVLRSYGDENSQEWSLSELKTIKRKNGAPTACSNVLNQSFMYNSTTQQNQNQRIVCEFHTKLPCEQKWAQIQIAITYLVEI